MVGSAVLGAATGTGLALVVAMTIVVYRYYAQKRYGKEWSDLERFGDSRGSYTKKGYTITQKVNLIKTNFLQQEKNFHSSRDYDLTYLHFTKAFLFFTSLLPLKLKCDLAK